jgi:hypothetical protein
MNANTSCSASSIMLRFQRPGSRPKIFVTPPALTARAITSRSHRSGLLGFDVGSVDPQVRSVAFDWMVQAGLCTSVDFFSHARDLGLGDPTNPIALTNSSTERVEISGTYASRMTAVRAFWAVRL